MTKVLKKQEKRKQIAKSTCDLFIKKGFVNISISEIAQVAGIGKGTVNENLQINKSTKEKVIDLFSLYLSDDSKVETQRNIYKEFLAITLNNPSNEIIKYQERMMKKYTEILTNIFLEGIANKEIDEKILEFIPAIFATMDGFFIARKNKEQILQYIDDLFSLLQSKGDTNG